MNEQAPFICVSDIVKTHTPKDLFFDQLNDIFSLESQLEAALPQLIPLTSSLRLRDLLVHRLHQTIGQRQMVFKVYERSGVEIGNDLCKAMDGLIEGGYAHLKDVTTPTTRDLMMIAHCLRINYYEIAAYTITARLASKLDMAGDAEMLLEILAEAKRNARHLLALEPLIFDLAMAA